MRKRVKGAAPVDFETTVAVGNDFLIDSAERMVSLCDELLEIIEEIKYAAEEVRSQEKHGK